MQVPDEVRKCVVFIGCENKAIPGEYFFIGSAFFMGQTMPIGEKEMYLPFLVTAAHTLDKAKERLAERVHLRVNLKDGSSRWIPCDFDQWLRHPEGKRADVATCFLPWSPEFDHLYIPDTLIPNEDTLKVEDQQLRVGQEVFITGLFRHHHGRQRNIPIVRAGNIAAMDEEDVITSENGPIQAYLIEARSIGGLSGSPVFACIPGPKTGFLHLPPAPFFVLLGLIHAHYDVDEAKIDSAHEFRDASRINMGIAIVVPWYKILEMLQMPEFDTARKKYLGAGL